jgi:hypothetical protein
MPGPGSRVGLLAGALAAVGAGCVAYGMLVERDWYRLRRERVEALEPGQPPLTLLHLSDLHLTAADPRRVAFLERLAAEPVDLVVLTGDMLGEPEGLDPVLDVLGRFRPRLGAVAVLGSNDYWAPRFRNPLSYFLGPSSRRWPAWTTPTSAATTPASPSPPTGRSGSASGWCTAPTGGSWRRSSATATSCCWPATPTAARCACPAWGRW